MEGEKLVCSSIIGADFEEVIINGIAYQVKAPVIKIIAGACFYLTEVKNNRFLQSFLCIGGLDSILCALSWFIQGNILLKKELSKGSYYEILEALDKAYSLINIKPFIEGISFSQEYKNDVSKIEVVGNDTLLGQIASFMENLHLTYTEVLEVIPYRNLVIMQKDKLHTTSGEVMKEVSDAEMFKNRKFDE